jgi:hypothetical protein
MMDGSPGVIAAARKQYQEAQAAEAALATQPEATRKKQKALKEKETALRYPTEEEEDIPGDEDDVW